MLGHILLKRNLFRTTSLTFSFNFKFMSSSSTKMTTEDWIRVQNDLKTRIILNDTEEWQKARIVGENATNTEDGSLTRIGGVDISYDKNNAKNACVCLVVLQLPDFKVIYTDLKVVEVDVEYVPGFLAFREVGFFVELLKKLRNAEHKLFPQVILVDGNGILHPNGFGLASHLGVLLDVPCIGVAKNLHHLPSILRDDEHKALIGSLKDAGDFFLLVDDKKKVLGKALKTSLVAKNPVFVSVGHKCHLDTACWVVMRCSIHRVPEPIRQADIKSREFLRKTAESSKLDMTTLRESLSFPNDKES